MCGGLLVEYAFRCGLFKTPASEQRRWYFRGMVDTALLETLELLTPIEQKAILAIAEYLKGRRADGANARVLTEALLAELPAGDPRFNTPDEGLSPARRAARRFIRENPTLMHLLAHQAGG